jgi:hypothetical protein
MKNEPTPAELRLGGDKKPELPTIGRICAANQTASVQLTALRDGKAVNWSASIVSLGSGISSEPQPTIPLALEVLEEKLATLERLFKP